MSIVRTNLTWILLIILEVCIWEDGQEVFCAISPFYLSGHMFGVLVLGWATKVGLHPLSHQVPTHARLALLILQLPAIEPHDSRVRNDANVDRTTLWILWRILFTITWQEWICKKTRRKYIMLTFMHSTE